MYSKILVPVDGSNTSNAGLNEAIKLAKALHACIRLLHVVDAATLYAVIEVDVNGSVLKTLREDGRLLLAQAQALVSRAQVEVDTAQVEAIVEPTGSCIVAEAREWSADLVVCGTHGRRGLHRLLMGSDAQYVLSHSPVPVLMVRAPDRARRGLRRPRPMTSPRPCPAGTPGRQPALPRPVWTPGRQAPRSGV